MGRFNELKQNLKYTYQEEGLYAVGERLALHAHKLPIPKPFAGEPYDDMNDFVDVLFINGCDFCVPHPIRYRVDHQAEQLEAVGMSTRIVNAWDLNSDYARMARTFIIFRCPYTDAIGSFIELAHSLNKRVLYDIDDLVIDTCYTDQIPFVAAMSPEDKAGYDDGVHRMGKTMMLCDGVITTTEQLACELQKYKETVFINRNVASEEMYYLSNKAVYERDVLPNMAEQEVETRDKHRWKVAKERQSKRAGFSIGYFSGSITHNDDFAMILPAIVRFMSEYDDVYLHIVGELDLPDELKPFASRVICLPFSPWRRLPQMISFVDVNLIPLQDTIFNRAKSENKWVEAGLVKVASIASNTGALADTITNDIDGLLCDSPDDWYEALVLLKTDDAKRKTLAQNAFNECTENHITFGTGMKLATFIRKQEVPNIAFVLPSLSISGGILVALKHAAILEKNGTDTTILIPKESQKDATVLTGNGHKADSNWLEIDGVKIPLIWLDGEASLRVNLNKMVATMWVTSPAIKGYPNVDQKLYLVQNEETNFYLPGKSERFEATKTYGVNPDYTYCTISTWCKKWLEEKYLHTVRYAPNGIDLKLFEKKDRDWSGKIRILIEGDSEVEYKNVDESFEIANKLDKSRFEVWYLSYNGKPKASYQVDKFFTKVPYEKVSEIYSQCHILLKTSVLESFSYPPLEMMATGGLAVVLRNEGNAAYLVDGENSLLFNQGEIDLAISHIERLIEDAELRNKLIENGRNTAEKLRWENIEEEILKLYA